VCEHLDWLTPAGQPKFEACSKLLARLEDAGELRLPSIQQHKSHPGPRSCTPRRTSVRTDPPAPIERPLSELDPVRLRWVSDPKEERLWNEYVERYHPLGITVGRPVTRPPPYRSPRAELPHGAPQSYSLRT